MASQLCHSIEGLTPPTGQDSPETVANRPSGMQRNATEKRGTCFVAYQSRGRLVYERIGWTLAVDEFVRDWSGVVRIAKGSSTAVAS